MSGNKTPAGNYYDKYHSKNPIERLLVNQFIDTISGFVRQCGARNIHEVGCGEGSLLLRFSQEGYCIRGSDISAEAVALARKNSQRAGQDIPLKVSGIQQLQPTEDQAELILCCEVLEHVHDPEAALAKLHTLASPYLIASVPREPLWRAMNMARGKYLRDWGNTPGHLQHWSSDAFLSFIATRFSIIAYARPLPWTVVLCQAK